MATFDPIRIEVIRSTLDGIADLMSLTLVRTARSPLVRNGWDFSCAVLTEEGELVGQGVSQPLHLAGMMPALRGCLERYKDDIHPGDVLANNDPYEGGSHLPDLFLFKPVFADDTLVGYLSAMVHHVDIGGRTPGSQAVDSTEIYQEGLRVPPLKLYRRGEPNETLLRILEKAVRTPDLVVADLQAQMAALRMGEMELLRAVRRFGVEEFILALHQLLDYSEQMTRHAVRSLPDGTWSFTDCLDNDGVTDDTIYVNCTLTKRDDEIFVDFDGSSPQSRGAIQGVLSTNKGMVYVVLKSLLGLDIPNTAGPMRAITVTAPEGSFVNPRLPAAVAARAMGCRIISHALWGAFAQAVPEKVCGCPGGSLCVLFFSGYDKTRTPWKPWILLDAAIGYEVAMGGRHDKDGIDANSTNVTQFANIPAEIIEAEFPIVIEEYSLRPDSGGPGTYRGGLGMSRQWRLKADETLVQVWADRSKRPPWGVAGGGSGLPPEVVVNPGAEERQEQGKATFLMDAGGVVRVEVSGAGGYGLPLKRDPQRVLSDVIEEKVSLQQARDVYGVAGDVETRTVDWETTRMLRQKADPR